MSKRTKTDYPGVYYRIVKRVGKQGTEKMYYVTYKRDGKTVEAKAGGQFRDDMTPARAARIRASFIEGKRLTREEKRQVEKAEAEKTVWTLDKIWCAYAETKDTGKSFRTDKSRYELYLKPTLGNKVPSDLILLDVDRIRHGKLKGKSPQTVKHVLALLQRINRYGVKRGFCAPLPFSFDKPKVSNIRTEDLTPAQLTRLLNVIDENIHPVAGPMMKMALFTGMRRGEMFKLQWSDIDFQRGFIHIRDPKGGIDQKIPLNDMARDLLEHHIKTSQYVFPGRGGNQRTDIKKAVNEIKTKADLPKDFRPLHGLRHVYASMLASSGQVDIFTIQKLLTHKDGRMTQRYAHLRDEALKKASDLAGNIIKKATEDQEVSNEQEG